MSSPSKTREEILNRMARLGVLRDLALLQREEVEIFDSLTALASKVIGAPVSLVSMVSSDHQFFKSMVGLPEPWASSRRTPLSHSFCQHVVASNEPLVVTDAREVDFLKDNLAIPDLDVIGYLGMPLTLDDGNPLGSFCVIDNDPREWTQVEVEIMNEMAGIVTSIIDARAQARLNPTMKGAEREAEHNCIQLIDALNVDTDKQVFLSALRAARQHYNL